MARTRNMARALAVSAFGVLLLGGMALAELEPGSPAWKAVMEAKNKATEGRTAATEGLDKAQTDEAKSNFREDIRQFDKTYNECEDALHATPKPEPKGTK